MVLDTGIIPGALFSDAFFQKYPPDFNRLAMILSKSGPIVKKMLGADIKPWQIAALLGMEGPLFAIFGHELEDLSDAQGFTVLHYYVVSGQREVVISHLTRYKPNFKAKTDEDYRLAEVAAAAGAVDILAIFGKTYGFDLGRLNDKLQTTLVHTAIEFDQEGIVYWLAQNTKFDPRKGRNLVQFSEEHARTGLRDYFQKLEQTRLGFGAYFNSFMPKVDAPATGLLNIPEPVLLQMGSYLSPADWAHLSTACGRLRFVFSKKIEPYKASLFQEVCDTRLIPRSVLSDPFFEKYPINYRTLVRILKKSGPIVKMMLSLDVQPWQVAALLGMAKALEETFGDQLVDLRDGEGYTVLHYYVVGGHLGVMRKHLAQHKPGFRATTKEDYGLAEMAAAAGSVDVLAIFSRDYGFDLKRLNEHLQLTLIHCAAQFDQDGTVQWLINRVGVDPTIGQNLVCFAAEHDRMRLYNHFIEQVGLSTNNTAEYNQVAIHLARCGVIDSIKEDIRKYGIDEVRAVRYRDDDILSSAIGGGQLETVKFCCRQGFGPVNQRW